MKVWNKCPPTAMRWKEKMQNNLRERCEEVLNVLLNK